uniref:Endonuclease/exonuclease/phosphatase domain-containing protein n=1 Tax=Sinocyclocheilus rhinocerous TaxID=307959 RepID=A0A673MEP9_9TELE
IDQVYSSTFNTRSRGVAILIRKGLDFKVHKSYNDQEGRWIALDSSLEGQKYAIMNIYAPNVMSPDFFNEVCNIIRNIGNCNIILGDFLESESERESDGAAIFFCCGAQGAVGGLVPCSRAPQSWY